MNGYKQFRESWLRSIPIHWETKKIKYLFDERSEKGHPNEALLVASQNMGVVPKTVYGNRTVEAMKDLQILKLVQIGDFVISLRSFQGGIEYAYYRGIISPAYTVMAPNGKITTGYFRLLAKSLPFIELLKLCVTGIREGQNIDYSKLKNHFIPLPPQEEQLKIEHYLDWQVSKINRLLSDKRKQIALLKELKQAEVDFAVTKGLARNIKMFNSGIDGIGLVPSHWKVVQNRRIYKENCRSFEGEDEIVLSLSQKDGLIPYQSMTERSLHTASYENWKLVYPNDLVLNRFKAHLGVFFSSTHRGIVTFHYGVFEPKNVNLQSKYYESLYHTLAFRQIFAGRSNGMTVGLQNLSNQNFYSAYTLLPPYDEQKGIVEKVIEIEEAYKARIALVQNTIELLHELRTRLISDVVTGQIDVRDVVVPDFEYVEEPSEEPIVDGEELQDDDSLDDGED